MTVTGNYFNKYESKNLLVNILTKRFVKTYIDMIPEKSITKWLDVGCGEGFLLQELVARYPDILISGIDIGSKELAIAKPSALTPIVT